MSREQLDHDIALGFTRTLATENEYKEVLRQHAKAGCKFCEKASGSGPQKEESKP